MRQSKTAFCFGYPHDLDHAYAFYCARYENITFKEFKELPLTDFLKKFGSIPESEPLHTIIKSRTIDTSKIKDKNERKYWNKLKKLISFFIKNTSVIFYEKTTGYFICYYNDIICSIGIGNGKSSIASV